MHRPRRTKLLMIVAIAVLGVAVTPPDAFGEEPPDDDGAADISDDAIVDAAREGVGDLAEQFVPKLEEGVDDPNFVKDLRQAKVRVRRRRLDIDGKSHLLAILSTDYPTANAITTCNLAVVFRRGEKSKLEAVADETFCHGGRTGTSLSRDVYRLAPDTPLLLAERGSWRGDHSSDTYIFYRVDQGQFEKVLSLTARTPQGRQKTTSERCTRPRFQTLDLAGRDPDDDSDTNQSSSGVSYPRALLATWVCRHDGSYNVTRIRSRIWTWQKGSFVESSPTDVDELPPIMGGPLPEEDD